MKFLKKLIEIFKSKSPMDDFDNNQQRVRESLTNMIYQHSKMLDKQSYLLDENENLAIDLEESVKEESDDLSLKIIEKLEHNKEELNFIDNQILEFENSIQELKTTKKEIDLSKGRYSDLLSVHESKKAALSAKKEILEQLNDLNSNREALSSKGYLSELKDQIHKTNAEIILLKDETNSNDSINELRRNRVKRSHLNKLQSIKQKLNDKNVIVVN